MDETALAAWIEAVCRELGLDHDPAATADVAAILQVAKHAAHQVMRPAAPVSTYLMGLAVARGADPGQVADRIGALAQQWAQQAPAEGGTGERPSGSFRTNT